MLMPETITSAANPLVKDVRRAIARGGLTERGWCIAEGFHLAEEALRSGSLVRAVLAAESTELRGLRLGPVRVTRIPDAVFHTMSSTEASQGVIALVEPRAWTPGDLFAANPLVVMLDGMQDPGNAGAIARSAEAFGATGAIFLKGSASPFHPKTLRGSAGSLFRLPFLHGVEPEAAIRPGMRLYAAEASAGCSLREADFTGPSILIIGSEGHGVRGSLRAAATAVSIPTTGVESLNAAVAAGVLLYEASRQRSQ
jgi:RNA methyltransferase, TrmH family